MSPTTILCPYNIYVTWSHTMGTKWEQYRGWKNWDNAWIQGLHSSHVLATWATNLSHVPSSPISLFMAMRELHLGPVPWRLSNFCKRMFPTYVAWLFSTYTNWLKISKIVGQTLWSTTHLSAYAITIHVAIKHRNQRLCTAIFSKNSAITFMIVAP